ncbi:MAG TPA: GAF domain-containing protein [Natronosporangium sp.]
MPELEAIKAAVDHADTPIAERAQQVAEIVRRTGGFRWVDVYEMTSTEVIDLAWSGPAPPAHPRFPVDRGLTADAVATGRTVACNDVRNNPRYLVALDSTGSEIIVPVTDATGEVVGTLDVDSVDLGAFDDATRHALEAAVALLPPL